ncbi:M56 family metallopeptidase [Bizionia argentinensis JUB59]|uniref:M56 family metallopeptidase n=1 Tax=Bizionia argentinensis JUB59 TaxID=1046627 RepID=G2EAI3_9FLAO|nr:M56 family metallopeptidase [Bizionia argentinensis]EGV44541.1 M56 family metallopeptidase [Bizionia argentinensis JUB59]
MDIYILKSSACLAIFMIFYKLILEKESIHHFKRFYLLAALLVSIAIPFITFTSYLEAAPIITTVSSFSSESAVTAPEVAPTFSDYLPTILWSIYFLGVVIFAGRFANNLNQLIKRIKQNPKYKNHGFVHVLMTDLVYPHTFLQFIFLNKTKYETHDIPSEVLLHEETHAKQKHALDILFIEILQIIFWFNPLLYFIKKDIKLNHEFLADQAVLNTGTDTKTYQHILLAFSVSTNMEDAQTHHLANAINYSLIKKRFTVMKSHTSTTVKWVKGLIILPLLAVLIYSFSSIKEVYAPAEPEIVNSNQKGVSKEQIAEYNRLATLTTTQITNQGFVKHKDVERLKYLYSLMTVAQKEKAAAFPDFSKLPPPPPIPANATPEQKAKYKNVHEDYNQKHKVKKGETGNIPPPPAPPIPPAPIAPPAPPAPGNLTPPPPAPPKPMTGTEENPWGISVGTDVKHESLRSNLGTPENPTISLSSDPIKEESDKNKNPWSITTVAKITLVGNGNKSDSVPPKTPPAPPEHMKQLSEQGASFSYNYKKITSKEAIKLTEENFNLRIHVSDDAESKKPVVKISDQKHAKTSVTNNTMAGDTAYNFVKKLQDKVTYFYNGKKTSYTDILKITKKEPHINVSTNINGDQGTVHFTSVK